MTTFEAQNLVTQFGLSIVALLTLIVIVIIFLEKKKLSPSRPC